MKNLKDKKLLICCCCGNQCFGRQWWNRDNGFGVCAHCIPYIKAGYRKDYREEWEYEFNLGYGKDGVHYFSDPTESFEEVSE